MLKETAREELKILTLDYHIETEGRRLAEPIISLFCRNGDGERRSVEVEGFHSHFWVEVSEFLEKKDQVEDDYFIRRIEVPSELYGKREEMNRMYEELEEKWETLQDKEVVKIVTKTPKQVPDARDVFEQTYEADVPFVRRFLVSSDIIDGVSIPFGEDRVHVDSLEPCEPPDVLPRLDIIDLEVLMDGSFPDPKEANNPITANTAYDYYDDEYVAWILECDEWEGDRDWELPDGVEECDIRVCEDESELLEDVISWLIDKDADILSGWNSSQNKKGAGFDYPYLINRSLDQNEWKIRDYAKDRDTAFVTDHGTCVLKGRSLVDMMQGYMKSTVHDLDSHALNSIAQDELGYGKEDVDNLDTAWRETPEDFLKYNIRDVQAVKDIEQKRSIVKLFDHIRSIAGCDYGDIGDSNIDIIDTLFLRKAYENNKVLPTSEEPDVKHYWGAKVFEPDPGVHDNVVYPDLSSLYPYLLLDLNMSPETLVGYEEDLRRSPYTKEDCHVVYVDTRDEEVKKAVDDPQRTEFYVLKPEVKESFIREIIKELVDMKYEYKSDEYEDEAYAAVKRITNSVYGVLGDSDTYGTGFRLFDWRIAEAITLAGRDVLNHTAEEFENYVQENGYPRSRVIYGDTDSCVCTIPEADGQEETLQISIEAAEYVDSTYEEYMNSRFSVSDTNMAVEIESYAPRAYFHDKKKRYAQWITWDEGDQEDEIEIKGFELIRSDSSNVTTESQEALFKKLLREDVKSAEEYVYEVWNEWDDSVEDIAKRSGMSNDLWDYGWSKKEVEEDDLPMQIDGEELELEDEYVRFYTPQPNIRGSRYANAYLSENISSGSKVQYVYVDRVRGDYPETYDYKEEELNAPEDLPYDNKREIRELDREVDCVAMEDISDLPEEFKLNWEKMKNKTIRDPIEPIFEVLGKDFDEVVSETDQSDLSSFM